MGVLHPSLPACVALKVAITGVHARFWPVVSVLCLPDSPPPSQAVGGKHPLLMAAAEQIFGAGGKKVRPTLCLLVSRSTAHMMGLDDIRPEQRRLAEITEMIHVASLVHDDVLDETKMRRGKSTVNDMYGSRIAVLTGDYLFAQSSWGLANLDNLEVIKLISQVGQQRWKHLFVHLFLAERRRGNQHTGRSSSLAGHRRLCQRGNQASPSAV